MVDAVKFCRQIPILNWPARGRRDIEGETRVKFFGVRRHILEGKSQDGRKQKGVGRAVDGHHLVLCRVVLSQVGKEASESLRPRHPLGVQAGFERPDLPDDGGNIILQRPSPQQEIGGLVHLNAVHHRVDPQGGEKRVDGGDAG